MAFLMRHTENQIASMEKVYVYVYVFLVPHYKEPLVDKFLIAISN